MDEPIITRDQIASTYDRIRPFVRRTPVLDANLEDFGLERRTVHLKLELFQHTGSFKPRGAFANLVMRGIPEAGVAAASGGNHGLAVAYAARRMGARARIFVPSVAATPKKERIAALGADLVIAGDRYDDALTASRAYVAESGALDVHAFDQRETLLGQGSVGIELERQCPDVDTLLVAVGGGGLVGGIAAWFDGSIKIVAVEPKAAPTLHDALAVGRPIDAPAGGIAADSLAPRRVGELMFPVAQRFVDHVVLVDDDAIVAAQRALWANVHVAAEPGGATAMAALLSGRYVPERGERVGVVVCGGNTDAVRL